MILFGLELLLIVIFGALLILGLDLLLIRHDLPTSRTARKEVLEIIKERAPNARIVYDLGSAHGSFARFLAHSLPTANVYGVDASLVRVLFARVVSFLRGDRARFLHKDILTLDLRRADVLYCYLWWTVLTPLEKKLLSELAPGAIVITNTSYFPNWKPVATYDLHQKTPDFERLFVYQREG